MKERSNKWSQEAKILLKELHKEISINDKEWHKLKSDHKRRAAELLISALSQLMNEGQIEDVQELVSQASRWLSNELKDPGCPTHSKR